MRLPSSLTDPTYRLFVAGNFFALQGMWAQRAVVGWLAWELSGSAAWVGLIAFLSFAPTLVSGPVFGVLADRANLRKAAIMTQGTLALVSFALFLTLITGVLTLHSLAAIALVQGVATSAHNPIRMALTPRLARREFLGNAIAISSLNFNLARLTGPAAGGYAIAHFGAAPAQVIVTLLSFPVMLVLLHIRPRPKTGEPPIREGLIASLSEGARYAMTHPAIRPAMVLTMIFALVVRGFLELLPVIADGAFHRGPSGLGALMASAGVGALCGALWLASGDAVREREGKPPSPPRRTYYALFGGLIGLIALSEAAIWPLALALVAVIGFCSTLVEVTMQSVVQISVDDGHRGRVMSLWIVVGVGSASIGSLLLGSAADLIGTGLTLRIAALVAMAMIGGLLLKEREA